jgi:hypothetical protein
MVKSTPWTTSALPNRFTTFSRITWAMLHLSLLLTKFDGLSPRRLFLGFLTPGHYRI